jgi:hypothetical protein
LNNVWHPILRTIRRIHQRNVVILRQNIEQPYKTPQVLREERVGLAVLFHRLAQTVKHLSEGVALAGVVAERELRAADLGVVLEEVTEGPAHVEQAPEPVDLFEGVEDAVEGRFDLRIVAGDLVEHRLDAVDLGNARVRTDDSDLGHVEAVGALGRRTGAAF